MSEIIPAYVGEEPYIFISYAHQDKDEVLKAISWLNEKGFRVWYDEGIEFGEDFPTDIAFKLERCFQFVVFISTYSINRRWVKKEIKLAEYYEKKILPIFLEKIVFPKDVEHIIAIIQGIRKYDVDENRFYKYMEKGLKKECRKEMCELPSVVPFLELFDVEKVEDLKINTRWQKCKSYLTLATQVGIKNRNEKILLDLHERGHGPHGIIVGAEGSGKNEFIQTLILSLAVNYHPDYLQFILFDFEGSGLANRFHKLPHLIDTYAEMGKYDIESIFAWLNSELKRRSLKLNQHNVYGIDSYQKLFRDDMAKEKMSHLVIIVYEYAKFKIKHPEMLEELLRIIRFGRSLGLHLILSTQNPMGVLNDMIWNLSRFKVCHKFLYSKDCLDFLKLGDLSKLDNPGRAYFAIGDIEMKELFQGGWSGGDYEPEFRDKSEFDYFRRSSDTQHTAILNYIVDLTKKRID